MRWCCDSCGTVAPDVVGPILLGCEGWGTFEIDDVYEGREWKAWVLLCGHRPFVGRGRDGGCAGKMRAYVDAGGRGGGGPKIKTVEGGRVSEAEFVATVLAA